MITGDVKTRIDRIWDDCWAGGLSNPLEIIEQITYLIFLRQLDQIETRREKQYRREFEVDMPDKDPTRLFRKGAEPAKDGEPAKPDEQDLRWSSLTNMGSPDATFKIVSERVFPWLRTLRDENSEYAKHMASARFMLPTASLLAKVMDQLGKLPLDTKDTKGDLYEYMLDKLSTSGQNGQFRTPRHIIQLIVEMMQPKLNEIICDPACGTAGFLVAAVEYVTRHYEEELGSKTASEHFHERMFYGYDFDHTMLRIAVMNMVLHDIEHPHIAYRDSLSDGAGGDKDNYTLILANPPFAGSLDITTVAPSLTNMVTTKKTELLFLALFLRLLKNGGRAAVIVPDGVLFGSTKAHKAMRKLLVEDHKLDAVVKLPSGVFKPYAGVSTAILFFTKTSSGGTDKVWFYEVTADGRSLDDKRQMLVDEQKFGPLAKLTEAEHERNNLPDVLRRWNERYSLDLNRERTEQSFFVPKEEIAEQGYDLSLNRYKQIVHEEVVHRSPMEILEELDAIEAEIQQGMSELKGMLS